MVILERVRHARGMTQQRLAKSSGVDSSYISKAENGLVRLYPSQLAKLAAALEWDGDPGELLEEAD